MRRAALGARLARHGLCLIGDFVPRPDDGVPVPCATMALVGPDEPVFWDHVAASPEMQDGAPDPIDRWSRRILDELAAELGAQALYPFGGPPWHPFIGWALRTGRIFTSPVTLLVHQDKGLFVSFRGALALPVAFEDTPSPAQDPCANCADKPCLSACPVAALGPSGYEVDRCHAFLDTQAGESCMQGCLVRRACPVGAGRRREAQSAYHMSRFHPR